MLDRIVITIDGLAASGKGAIAKELAKRLNYIPLDTGAIYRMAAFLVVQNNISPDDDDEIVKLIKEHQIEIKLENGEPQYILDGRVCGDEIRTNEISQNTSKVSRHPKVRAALAHIQREAFKGHNIVTEGRDQGTAIFPDAQVKFFVDADINVKAERRLLQLHSEEVKEDQERYAELLRIMKNEIMERDNRDSNRAADPAKPAKDAIIIDNSEKSLTDLVTNLYNIVQKRIVK